MSAEEITTYWSNYNATDINPIITQLPNTNTSDGSTVERRVWENGDSCVRVEELKVIGGDHDWPGAFGNLVLILLTLVIFGIWRGFCRFC